MASCFTRIPFSFPLTSTGCLRKKIRTKSTIRCQA
ncbi:TPA: hypothetical protein G9E90_004871 [Salmonella enterica]|nr:hypothetical protein [Salmonella enterica]